MKMLLLKRDDLTKILDKKKYKKQVFILMEVRFFTANFVLIFTIG